MRWILKSHLPFQNQHWHHTHTINVHKNAKSYHVTQICKKKQINNDETMIKPDSVIHFIQWVKNILSATRRANRAYCKYIVVKSKTERMKRIQPNRVNTFHFVRMRKFPFWRMPSMYVIILFFSSYIFIDKSTPMTIDSRRFMFLPIPFWEIGKFRCFFSLRWFFFLHFRSSVICFGIDAPFAGYHICWIFIEFKNMMQAQIGVKFKNMNYLVRIQFSYAPLQECCQIVARSIADGWDLDLSLLVLSWTCAHCIYFYAVLHCLCALWSPAECITFCGTQQNLHTTLHLLQLYKRKKNGE